MDLVDLRRQLHAHPELSGSEYLTASRIVDYLAPLGPAEIVEGVGGAGVIATFDSGIDGPVIMFRAELDALPIAEDDVGAHTSTNPGVSHKCGHDGHMAMICGVAARLAEQPTERGAVQLLFQPAEETGRGAAAVLADPLSRRLRPDMAFAIHNLPGVPWGTFVVKSGSITAAVRSLIVRFGGRTTHASDPLNGRNPARAVADLLGFCDGLNAYDPNDPGFRLATPVHVLVGSPAYGVAAGDGEAHFTIRSWTNVGLDRLQDEIVGEASSLAERDGLTLGLETVEDFLANTNDPHATAVAERALIDCGSTIASPTVGFTAGEDFGVFSELFPCCMVMLGVGENAPPLHGQAYDFDDALIEHGVRFYERIIRTVLGPDSGVD